MTMPKDSANATRFTIIVSNMVGEVVQKSNYTFESTTTLGEVFNHVFADGRIEFQPSQQLPFCMEIGPDLATLPQPKTIHELLADRRNCLEH